MTALTPKRQISVIFDRRTPPRIHRDRRRSSDPDSDAGRRRNEMESSPCRPAATARRRNCAQFAAIFARRSLAKHYDKETAPHPPRHERDCRVPGPVQPQRLCAGNGGTGCCTGRCAYVADTYHRPVARHRTGRCSRIRTRAGYPCSGRHRASACSGRKGASAPHSQGGRSRGARSAPCSD